MGALVNPQNTSAVCAVAPSTKNAMLPPTATALRPRQ